LDERRHSPCLRDRLHHLLFPQVERFAVHTRTTRFFTPLCVRTSRPAHKINQKHAGRFFGIIFNLRLHMSV
jgi:hypothetical protein